MEQAKNATVNNMIQNTKTKIGSATVNLKDGSNELIAGNYVLIMGLLISFILFLIIYFTSKKTFRVGRTVSTMNIYQKFQELQDFLLWSLSDLVSCFF